MLVIGWILVTLVVLVVAVVIYKIFFGGPNNAMGYNPGQCPNMGACEGCDVCEGD